MTSDLIGSGPRNETTAGDDEQDIPGQRGFARPFHAALDLVSACRSRVALETMSERDLDDLGLLPSEVRSDFIRWGLAAA
ncbi:hypothetical protein [Mesorhizobium marinum]|uniref:DUF1127 domain-containing protein n=1 Tax=Mesorhizobium marinum TaxID=3228790 RepID=A0ABV3QWI7_9HYPH